MTTQGFDSSEVLVGGFKPEEIQKKYLVKKEREDAQRKRESENKQGSQDQQTQPSSTVPAASRAKMAGNIAYGRFSAASITKGGWGFEFHGVKLPIGDIEVIHLQDWLSPRGGGLYNFRDFAQHNKELYDDDNMFCVPPIWLHYGLMAAAYDLRGDLSCKPAIDELRATVWTQAANADGLYSSTLVNDGSIKYPDAFVRHGEGLPIHHPLYSQHRGSIAGKSGEIALDRADSSGALSSLLFEYQPHHLAKVLIWAMGPPHPDAWIVRQPKSPFGAACAVLQNMIEPNDGFTVATVNTTYDLGMHRHAHMVEFDYSKFTPILKLLHAKKI